MDFSVKKSEYPPEQCAYAARVADILSGLGFKPKACVITYGCQQNVSDSERMKGELALMGYDFTDEPGDADFILFNTCAVRGHAEDRVYGNVGAMKHLKRRKPHLLLCVCGCMAQQDSVCERFCKSYPYVDIVFGTQVQHRLPELVYRRLSGEGRIFETELSNDEIIEGVPVRRDGNVKGWLPVMRGCDNFCTYCIVPYVRGRERSRDAEEILREAREMVAAGFKEIMLLGQNVNSYGKGIEGGITFAELLRRVNDIEGDFRIRFMTSHPKDCTPELLDAMRDCEKVERHLHLPFQSGSDRILRAMNRRYDRETYLGLIKAARERMPDIAFTSDIIVGFPGEEREDFEQTVSLIKEVKFTSLFTFIYSPREGTPAAAMPDPVSRKEKGKRLSELLRVQEEISVDVLGSLVGTTQRVLCEEVAGDGILRGKTSGTVSVEFNGPETLVGEFADVRIDSYTNVLKGTII